MLELIKTIESGQTDYSEIAGLVFKKENVIVTNKERELIKDISELPLPNRKKIDINKYIDTWRKHYYGNQNALNKMICIVIPMEHRAAL